MATIKFKRTTTINPPSGLTFGEPAFVQGINSFYVTNSSGTSVRVGAEVDTDTLLAANSDNRLPTQKAVKQYVDGAVGGGAVSSVNGLTGTVSLNAGTAISIATGSGSDKGITFTNTGVQSLTLSATANGGLAVSGAGTTGALTKSVTLDFANFTAVTAATGDLVPIGDASDSNNPKDVTIGGILDIINGDVNVDSNGTSSIAAGAIVDADIATNAAITVTKLAAFTISGHTLGNNLSTLTIGDGLGGTSYNGSAAVTITNTGVTGIAAGTGISVSASTGNVTITNTGVQSLAGTTNQITITPSGGTGALTASLPSAITTPGSLTTTGNLTVGGDLTVNGTTTTVNSTTLSVEDPLIKLAKGNSAANTLDIGFYGLYDPTGAQDTYAGLFRDASDGKWRLFTGLETEPTTTVDTGGAGYSIGTLVANLEGNASSATNATNATNVIATEQTSGSSVMYLVGMAAAGTTGGLFIDASAQPGLAALSYTPASGTLTAYQLEAIVDGGSYT